MRQCPKCQANISNTAKFCMECGCNIKKYEEEHAQPKARFCPECGTEISKGAFCPECGYSIGNNLNNEVTSATDAFGDDWLSDLESTTSADVKNLKDQQSRVQTEKAFAMFEYKEHADGTYTITGLKDKSALTVFVPQGVVNIADHAFEGSQMLQVTLPEGLMMIGRRAFAGCKYIEAINLPATLRVVEEEAFADCDSLEIDLRTISNVGKDAIKNTFTDKKLRAEEARQAEETRRAEEARRAEKERRAAEARKAEETRKAVEALRAEEARKAAEALRAEEERKAEEIRKEEKRKLAKEEFENKKRLEATVRREGEFVYFGAYPQRLWRGMRAIKSTPIDNQGYHVLACINNVTRYDIAGTAPYLVEPIQWRILSEDDETLYLMSTKALDAQAFSKTNNNYEKSDIRAWLNDVFFNKAFNPDAQRKICEIKCNNCATTTDSANNPYSCEDTIDKVALITFSELQECYGFGSPYFESLQRTIKYTEYAFSKSRTGGKLEEKETDWWTRSPSSHHSDFVLGVNKHGQLRTSGPFKITPDTVTLRADQISGVVPIIKVYKN